MAISGHAKLIYTLMGGAMVFSCVLYTIWMRSAERIEDDRHQFGQQGSTAIVILGGGLLRDGSVPSHTLLRIERAVQIYHDLKGEAVIIPLSGGTPHKPNPLDIEVSYSPQLKPFRQQLFYIGIPCVGKHGSCQEAAGDGYSGEQGAGGELLTGHHWQRKPLYALNMHPDESVRRTFCAWFMWKQLAIGG